MFDFHSHTFLSDGSLSTLELVRRAVVAGYSAIAVTDHVGRGSLERLVREVREDCELATRHWKITALPGVELTHVPPAEIAGLARRAKELGAAVVVVHGETLSEPVSEGTNLAAARCPQVDILAHPGILSGEAARAAAENGVFIEITTRKSHSQTNTGVARAALAARAEMVVNSDTHEPEDLLDESLVAQTLRTAGILDQAVIARILQQNPAGLLARVQALSG
ncbi:MAG: histidinol phosphate phosphatase domain-containing protein [Chloroflexi bacterium]|nr:histidinol phosphate phosphatase domain-containing protein [Chloroflexota bacterium]